MIFAYILIALFISWIWIEYFVKIDIYNRNSKTLIFSAFGLGCISVFVVFFFDWIIAISLWSMNDNIINNFLFCWFKIGLVEEISKSIPLVILFFPLKKHFKEPIDIIAFLSFSALGFSTVENIMYFINYGAGIITSRAILCSVGHMFYTSLIGYGIIKVLFTQQKFKILQLIGFTLLAALCHGFYDFWLFQHNTGILGKIISILFFLECISLFSVVINNSLNHSSFFTYKLVIDSQKIESRLLLYYGIVFLIQLIILTIEKDVFNAFLNFFFNLIFSGFIVFVSVIRLSRFKLIKSRWFKLKIELPFRFVTLSNKDESKMHIEIKGDSYNEVYLNKFYQEIFYLIPISQKKNVIGQKRIGFIKEKHFTDKDESYYSAKLYHYDENGLFDQILIKPKKSGANLINRKYPIVGIYEKDLLSNALNNRKNNQFKFIEWVYLVPKI